MAKSGIYRASRGLILALMAIFGIFDFALAQSVLPKGIIHPRFVFGRVTEVSSRFNDEGSLNSIGRFNQTIDSEFLQTIVPEFERSVDILNNASNNLRLGDEINLGSLEFEGGPEVDYFAPVLAYGVSESWTLGVAVPIISLNGGVTVTQTGENNVSAIRSMIASQGTVVQSDVLAAFDNVSDLDLVAELRKTLRARGYKDLNNRSTQTIGDVQVFSFYEYFKTARWSFYLEKILNLPTGPEDDPDDLIDIPNMHQLGFQIKSHHDLNINNRLMVGAAPGYFFKAPDSIVKRVPENERDLLPKPTRKENLDRDVGDIFSLDTYSRIKIWKFLSANAGMGFYYKQADTYNGKNGWDYSLLERNTESDWIKYKLGGSFSTVELFQEGNSALPYIVSYNFSDILTGRNVVRQQVHELSFLMFF